MGVLFPVAIFLMVGFAIIKFKHALQKNKQNFILALYFSLLFLSVILMIIYKLILPYVSDFVYLFLVRLTGFVLAFAAMLPLYFVQGLLVSFQTLTKQRTQKVFGFAVLISLPTFFIGNTWLDRQAGRHYIDIWAALYVFLLIVFYFAAFLRLNLQLIQIMKEKNIRNRIIQFTIGYLSQLLIMLLVIIVNLDWLPQQETFIANTLAIIASTVFLYLGIGRTFEKKTEINQNIK